MALTPVSLGVLIQMRLVDGVFLLYGAAYAAVADFKPLLNLLITFVDSERLFDIES